MARRLPRGGSRTFGEMEEHAMIAAGELTPLAEIPPTAISHPIEIDEIDDNDAAAALNVGARDEEDIDDGR